MSGRRKKTDEEKAWIKNREYTNVVCKLSRVCSNPVLVDEIKRTCAILKQVQLEASHVANLHILRCLANDLPLPDLDSIPFYYRCCTGVFTHPDPPGTTMNTPPAMTPRKQAKTNTHLSITADDSEERADDDGERRRKGLPCRDHDLFDTLALYRERRACKSEYKGVTFAYHAASLAELAAEMRVNTQNMIALQFVKRLRLFVRLRYQLDRKKTAQIIRECFRVWGPLSKTSTEIRNWLAMIPYEESIKQNLGHFVRKLHDILLVVEDRQREFPTERGVRSFSLLPTSTSYVAAHVTVNGSTFHGICARIYERTGGIKGNGMNVMGVPLAKRGGLVSPRFFQLNRDQLLRQAFSVAQFETRRQDTAVTTEAFSGMGPERKREHANRYFAGELCTNGYSVSVLLTRLKSADELEKQQVNKSQTKARHKSGRSDNEHAPIMGDNAALDLPEGYLPDVVVGIDPGMRTMATAVCEGELPVRLRKRSRRVSSRVQRRGWLMSRGKRKRKRKNKRFRFNRKIHAISTREYRHLAHMHKFQYWLENLKRREPTYFAALASVPSFKTANFESYLFRLNAFWERLNFLLEFCASHGFLKWRFVQAVMKKRALDLLARRIVPRATRQVCVAYGNWCQRDGISGHPPVPVKGFRKALAKRATVVVVNEYRTSKLCSNCHESLEKARLLTNTKDEGIVLKPTRNVLRCANSNCKANFWNRDVNAALNILFILKSKLRRLNAR